MRQRKASKAPTLGDFANDAMSQAANAAVGFCYLKTILESIEELSKTSPDLAAKLARAGAYWADLLEAEVQLFQDAIEEGGAA